ncbi:unnamed protein product [Amoebophrya sp. A25]|nr:unnamed protein product [Amoebophrya sp. A25]|eukprot:GSA25T00000155001.1
MRVSSFARIGSFYDKENKLAAQAVKGDSSSRLGETTSTTWAHSGLTLADSSTSSPCANSFTVSPVETLHPSDQQGVVSVDELELQGLKDDEAGQETARRSSTHEQMLTKDTAVPAMGGDGDRSSLVPEQQQGDEQYLSGSAATTGDLHLHNTMHTAGTSAEDAFSFATTVLGGWARTSASVEEGPDAHATQNMIGNLGRASAASCVALDEEDGTEDEPSADARLTAVARCSSVSDCGDKQQQKLLKNQGSTFSTNRGVSALSGDGKSCGSSVVYNVRSCSADLLSRETEISRVTCISSTTKKMSQDEFTDRVSSIVGAIATSLRDQGDDEPGASTTRRNASIVSRATGQKTSHEDHEAGLVKGSSLSDSTGTRTTSPGTACSPVEVATGAASSGGSSMIESSSATVEEPTSSAHFPSTAAPHKQHNRNKSVAAVVEEYTRYRKVASLIRVHQNYVANASGGSGSRIRTAANSPATDLVVEEGCEEMKVVVGQVGTTTTTTTTTTSQQGESQIEEDADTSAGSTRGGADDAFRAEAARSSRRRSTIDRGADANSLLPRMRSRSLEVLSDEAQTVAVPPRLSLHNVA